VKPALFLLSRRLSQPATNLLQQAATSAGWRQHEYEIGYAVETDLGSVGSRGYNLIAAFGDGAAAACLGDDWEAGYCQQRRGYLWEAAGGGKVLTLLDPEEALVSYDPSGISGMLLQADLERAKKESYELGLNRQHRTISIISSLDAVVEPRKRMGQGLVACDIECTDPNTLLCVGFAISSTEAYVFVGEALAAALEIVADPAVRKVFQNGAFDVYFLKTRCGVSTASYTDDCMIAWHALWPEIAGKSEKKSAKKTRKSLAFLISLYCDSPEWHKDYDTDEAGMYQLCGIDVCTTLEIIQKQLAEIEDVGVADIYRHEMSMQPVLVAIQERGLLVNEKLRLEALETLGARAAAAEAGIRSLAEPIIRERRTQLAKPHLFFGTKRCPCCNNGKSKRMACWSCAGLDSSPGNKAIKESLRPCTACGGVGGWEVFEYNPGSTQQQVELFYNCLKMPPKYNDGKPTVDEKALKNLLATV
jgi:uncharacterized protein YunC (DUF1805 family)